MSSGNTLFDIFGGIRPMASELGERPSTVQDWKKHGRVPATKQPHVLITAMRLGLPVSAMLIIFPLGIPTSDANQPDLFPDAAAADAIHGGVVPASAPIVACDRSAILHPESRNG